MIQKVSTNNDIFYMLATFVVHEYYAHSKECKLAISLVHLKGKLGDRLENFQSLDRFIERFFVLGLIAVELLEDKFGSLFYLCKV